MLRLLPAVILLGGCAIYRGAMGIPDPDLAAVALAAAPVIECPAENISSKSDGKHGRLEWTAEGCAGTAACTHMHGEWRCFALPAPEWIGREDEELVIDLINRLTVETACPRHRIQTAASFAASTSIGAGEAIRMSFGGSGRSRLNREKDVAYRFVACGRSYVCSRLEERTECKAALAEAQPE